MSQTGEAFDSNCMTLTRFIIQEQKKFKVHVQFNQINFIKFD